MKKIFIKLSLFIICCLSLIFLTGCTTDTSSADISNKDDDFSKIEVNLDEYNIGDEIILGDIYFNIYKIDYSKKEVYLLAKNNIATTRFSHEERDYKEEHNYDGSLIQEYVESFVNNLEDKGFQIKSSGIIDKDDLYALGFEKSVTVSGRPYLCTGKYEFIKNEQNYWLDGYYRVDTYAWAYCKEEIDTYNCEEEFGVRPIIVIDSKELKRQSKELNANIKDIIISNTTWICEGGIHNPYDSYYFDCENMLFINTFESSELNEKCEYKMQFIDDKTIQIDGLTRRYETPAKLTLVDTNKIRITFIDNTYNNGDYFLVPVNETN